MNASKEVSQKVRTKLRSVSQWIKTKIQLPKWIRGKKGAHTRELVIGPPTNVKREHITFGGDLPQYESVIKQAQEDAERIRQERQAHDDARHEEWKRRLASDEVIFESKRGDEIDCYEEGLLPPLSPSGSWGNELFRGI